MTVMWLRCCPFLVVRRTKEWEIETAVSTLLADRVFCYWSHNVIFSVMNRQAKSAYGSTTDASEITILIHLLKEYYW